MALQPSLRPLIIAGTQHAPHTLDVFREWYRTGLSQSAFQCIAPSRFCVPLLQETSTRDRCGPPPPPGTRWEVRRKGPHHLQAPSAALAQ